MSEGIFHNDETWICKCHGTWYRDKSVIRCKYCMAIRPEPRNGKEKILDKALRKIHLAETKGEKLK